MYLPAVPKNHRKPYDEEAHTTPKTCGISRKLFLVLLVVAAVLVTVGLGVGLGVGLSSGGGSPAPSPSPPPPPADGPSPSTPGGLNAAPGVPAPLAPGTAPAPTPVAQPAPDPTPAPGGSRSDAASPATAAPVPTAAPTRRPAAARSPPRTPAPAGGTPPPPPPPMFDAQGRLLLSLGDGPVLEGGNCTAPADCQQRNSSCIFAWTNGTLDTTVGFCALAKLPDLASCTKDEDCESNSCKDVQGVGRIVCAPGTGAPCSRSEQCAFACTRPFCF